MVMTNLDSNKQVQVEPELVSNNNQQLDRMSEWLRRQTRNLLGSPAPVCLPARSTIPVLISGLGPGPTPDDADSVPGKKGERGISQ